MLTAGPRARFGLLSPADRPIERGDPFTVAFGIWGALNCRAGWVAEDADDLPDGVRDYVDRLVAPYFEAVAEWYGALHVGRDRRRAPGDHRPPPGRPVLRHLPQPGPPAPPRRVGELAGLAAARRSSCGPGWRCRSTSSRPRARRSSRPTSRTGSRSPTRRCGPRSQPPTRRRGRGSRRGGRSCATPLGIDLHPDVLPFSNIPAVAAAVPAPAGPRDDARLTARGPPARARSGARVCRFEACPAILRRSKYMEYSHAIVRVGGSSAARAGEEARGHHPVRRQGR